MPETTNQRTADGGLRRNKRIIDGRSLFTARAVSESSGSNGTGKETFGESSLGAKRYIEDQIFSKRVVEEKPGNNASMPRPRNVEPSVRLSAWLPESLHARLLLEAYSPLHGKTAPGGLTAILSAALKLYFDQKDALSNVQP